MMPPVTFHKIATLEVGVTIFAHTRLGAQNVKLGIGFILRF